MTSRLRSFYPSLNISNKIVFNMHCCRSLHECQKFCIVQLFYLIYVLNLFNGVDDVMLRNSCGFSIRGLARTKFLSTSLLAQEWLSAEKCDRFFLPGKFLSSGDLSLKSFPSEMCFWYIETVKTLVIGLGISPSQGGPASTYGTAGLGERFGITVLVSEWFMRNHGRRKFRKATFYLWSGKY
jgi:hypothetical protein